MTGLVVARAVQHAKGKRVVLIERERPGGQFSRGSPKFLVATPDVTRLLHEFGVTFSTFLVVRGILLRGKVHTYPRALINNPSSQRIQRDYWSKSRRVMPDDPTVRLMDDATTHCPKSLVRCDEEELVARLARGLHIERADVTCLTRDRLYTTAGDLGFWRMVTTVPLWELEPVARFHVPVAVATKMLVASVVPYRDRYSRWDLVYTPYTPTNTVHRMVSFEEGYAVEASGDPTLDDLHGDLQFLFPEGYYVKRITSELNGELVPMLEKPDWPHGVIPAGRYSQWVPDFRFHDSVARAKEVLRCLP